MTSFEQRRAIVYGESQSLRVFLMSRLQEWRWKVMLESGGIRVERGGTRVSNLTPEYQLSAGDVVVIDEAFGTTWLALVREAALKSRDLLFAPGRDGDEYLTNKYNFQLLNSKVKAVDSSLKTLSEFVKSLTKEAKDPIRHLICVSHANPFGEIALPMRAPTKTPDLFAESLTWDSLNEAQQLKYLDITANNPPPTVLPRPEDGRGRFVPCAFIIRGCRAGIHEPLLAKIRQTLGTSIDLVIMPKFFDAATFIDFQNPKRYAAAIEFFMHDFTVSSKTQMTRDEVIAAYKAAGLTDWLGARVPDSEWDRWVPKKVDQNAETVDIPVTVPGRKAEAKPKARFDFTSMSPATETISQTTEPTEQEMREAMMKRWSRHPAFQNRVWPMWERMGVSSFEEFANFWTYRLDPDVKPTPGQWAVQAVRFVYTVRTPLVQDGTLICDYYPTGEEGTKSLGIDYNDARIFGQARFIPNHFAPTIDR